MKTLFAIFNVALFALAAVSARAADDRTWKTPVPVEESDSGNATASQLAFDGQGNLLAVWSQPDDEARNRTWSSRYTALGGWSRAAPIDSTAGGTSEPHVALDASGNALAIWLQFDGTRNRIGWSRYAADRDRWVAGTNPIDTNTGNTFAPQVATEAGGNALAVWAQSVGTRTRIWWSRYTASNNQWVTATAPLDTNTGNAVSPQIAFGTNGSAIAVWQQSDGTRTNIFASRYVGGTWGTAAPLETGTGNALAPRVAIDGSGNAFAVWHQFDSGRNRIFANRFTANAWLGATAIETNAGEASSPRIAFDAGGKAVVVWQQTAGGSSDIWANHFTPSGPAGVWSGATRVEADAGTASAPVVAFDADGIAMATWQQFDGQRVSIRSNLHTTNQGWGAAGSIENDNAGDALQPRVAFDTYGSGVVVWLQSDGTRSNITASRYTREKQFGKPELIEPGNGWLTNVRLAFDSNGSALALWSQPTPTGIEEIFWNRYAPSEGWGTRAQFDTRFPSGHGGQNLVSAPDHSALAVWTHASHNWSRRYTANAWDTPVRIDTGSDEHSGMPSFAPDADGNGLATWVQRVSVNGQPTIGIQASRYTISDRRWGPPEQIGPAEYGSGAHVRFDASGNALAVWLVRKDDGARHELWWNRYHRTGGWATPSLIAVDAAAALFHLSELQVDAGGNALLIWIGWDGTRQSIWAQRYTPGGNWDPASRLGSGGTSESYVDVTFAPDGTALAVWAQDDGGTSRIWFNRYTPENRWGTAAIIRPELSAQLDEYAPQLAFDSTGKALMVFHVVELLDATDPDELPRSHFSAWAMRYTAGGGWTGLSPIASSEIRDAHSPGVAFHANDNGYALWNEAEYGSGPALWWKRFE
jgi:hypothetical protein